MAKKKKSNHKHNYEKCIMSVGHQFDICKYCTICGKFRTLYPAIVETENGYKEQSPEEIVEMYGDIPFFRMSMYKYFKTNTIFDDDTN